MLIALIRANENSIITQGSDATALSATHDVIAAASLEYKPLKPKQYQAVEDLVSGKHVLVSLPTGCGKSLCYAILPLVYTAKLDR